MEWGVGSGGARTRCNGAGRARRDGAPFLNPHSPLPTPHSPSEPGTVIALKVSHCIHIASGSHVTPEAMCVVMI